MDTLALATEAAALWTGVTDDDCRYEGADGLNVKWSRNSGAPSATAWAVSVDLCAIRLIVPRRCIPGTVWTVEP